MAIWCFNIVLTFLLSIFLAEKIIQKILLIAFIKKLFDKPEKRKIHNFLVPRLGGIAFNPVIFFTLSLILGINLLIGNHTVIQATFLEFKPIAFVYCAMMVLYMIGVGDDLIGIRYEAKFIAQIIAAILLIAGGLYINNFQGFLGIYELNQWIAYPFTILMIVFIINAMNLIDGIDGLASGLSCIAILLYAIVFFLYGKYFYTLISVATLGVLLPFFYYNVFGHPEKQRKIFMGDTGSLTLGTIICFLSLRIAMKPLDERDVVCNSLVWAFSPILVPCLDVIRVYINRVRRGNNPFLPDKTHIHHKLLATGMGPRTSMVAILYMSILFTLVNIALSFYLNITLILLIDILIWIAVNRWISYNIKQVNCIERHKRI